MVIQFILIWLTSELNTAVSDLQDPIINGWSVSNKGIINSY